MGLPIYLLRIKSNFDDDFDWTDCFVNWLIGFCPFYYYSLSGPSICFSLKKKLLLDLITNIMNVENH